MTSGRCVSRVAAICRPMAVSRVRGSCGVHAYRVGHPDGRHPYAAVRCASCSSVPCSWSCFSTAYTVWVAFDDDAD